MFAAETIMNEQWVGHSVVKLSLPCRCVLWIINKGLFQVNSLSKSNNTRGRWQLVKLFVTKVGVSYKRYYWHSQVAWNTFSMSIWCRSPFPLHNNSFGHFWDTNMKIEKIVALSWWCQHTEFRGPNLVFGESGDSGVKKVKTQFFANWTNDD
mgnify:FL=1